MDIIILGMLCLRSFFRISLLVLSLLPSSGGHPFALLQIVPLGRGIVIDDLLEQSVIDGVPQTSSVWISSGCRRQSENPLPGDQLLGLFGCGGGQVGQLSHLKFPQPRIIHIPVQGQPSRSQSVKGNSNRVEMTRTVAWPGQALGCCDGQRSWRTQNSRKRLCTTNHQKSSPAHPSSKRVIYFDGGGRGKVMASSRRRSLMSCSRSSTSECIRQCACLKATTP